MRDLAGLQKEFLSRILTGGDESGNIGPSAQPSGAGESSIRIYRDLVATNHLGALKEVYPVCRRLVGEKYFSLLAWSYLRERPTSNPDLNRYGEDFAGFLEREVGVRDELDGLGYLPGVCRFEWSVYRASRAEPAFMPLEDTLSKLISAGDKDTVWFRVNPSLSLMEFTYPVVRIWKENQLEEVGGIELERTLERAAVWNNRGDVLFELVDEDTFNLLKLFQRTVPLKELNDIYPDRERKLEHLIGQSISRGWIIDVEEALP